MLKQRGGVEVVGLTSDANQAFCNSLGCYDRVLTYRQLDQVAADVPCIYIDFAGNADLRMAVHTRFANLQYSCSIGAAHVEQLGGAKNLPGPRATLFFAPAQVKKRHADWGAQVMGERMVQAWREFTARAMDPVAPWLTVQRHLGPAAAQAAYQQVLAGRGDARVGHVLSVRPPG